MFTASDAPDTYVLVCTTERTESGSLHFTPYVGSIFSAAKYFCVIFRTLFVLRLREFLHVS